MAMGTTLAFSPFPSKQRNCKVRNDMLNQFVEAACWCCSIAFQSPMGCTLMLAMHPPALEGAAQKHTPSHHHCKSSTRQQLGPSGMDYPVSTPPPPWSEGPGPGPLPWGSWAGVEHRTPGGGGSTPEAAGETPPCRYPPQRRPPFPAPSSKGARPVRALGAGSIVPPVLDAGAQGLRPGTQVP